MLLNECKVLTDDCHLNDLFAELEKRYAGTLLCITTHSEPCLLYTSPSPRD